MAFPSVDSTTTNAETSNTASHTVSYPPTIASGDKILAFTSNDGSGDDPDFTSSDLTAVYEGTFSNGGMGLAEIASAVGDEDSGSTEYSTPSTETSSNQCWAISGTDTSEAPDYSGPFNDQNPLLDPPSLTPVGGAKDYLWIVFCAVDIYYSNAVSTWPSGYTDNQVEEDDGSRAKNFICSKDANASSDDPGTCSLSGASGANCGLMTIAVHPAGAAAAVLPSFRAMNRGIFRGIGRGIG